MVPLKFGKYNRPLKLSLGLAAFLLGTLSLWPENTIRGCWQPLTKNLKARGLVCINFNKIRGVYEGKGKKLYGYFADSKCISCKGKQKNQKVVGLKILTNLKQRSGKYHGFVLDPKDGQVYRCAVWREGNTLKVRGYWGAFYETRIWVH